MSSYEPFEVTKTKAIPRGLLIKMQREAGFR